MSNTDRTGTPGRTLVPLARDEANKIAALVTCEAANSATDLGCHTHDPDAFVAGATAVTRAATLVSQVRHRHIAATPDNVTVLRHVLKYEAGGLDDAYLFEGEDDLRSEILSNVAALESVLTRVEFAASDVSLASKAAKR